MKRHCLIVVGVVSTVAVADAQTLSVQSKPARAHANVATVASSALRSEGPGGVNLSNPNANPVGAGIAAIAPFPGTPTDDTGVSDSCANSQDHGNEVKGPEVFT